MQGHQLKDLSRNSISNESYDRHHVDLFDEDERSIALCYKGDFEEAFQKFYEGGEKARQKVQYWIQKGVCFALKKELFKAELYTLTAFSLAKDSKVKATVYNNLGAIYERAESFSKAIISYKKAIETHAGLKTPRYNLARLLTKNGNVQGARVVLRELQKKSAGDPDLELMWAHLDFLSGDLKQAQGHFQNSSGEEKMYGDAYLNYPLLLMERGQLNLANELLSRVKSLSPRGKVQKDQINETLDKEIEAQEKREEESES